jgi:hypothetical protein
MAKKQELGQFYTTKAEYIIGSLFKDLPDNISIVDPFAGNWDMLSLAEKKLSINNIHAYDLDPQNQETIQQDTLLNPPDYKGLYVITNPPYLARNKTKDQAIFEKYDVFDLYKAAIETFMGCEGGILIVPLNFLCDEIRSNKSSVHINRLTAELKAGYHISNIKLYATDSGAKDGMIRLEKDTIPFYGKETDRTFATIISDCKLDDVEDIIIEGFNKLLNCGRIQYHSLFLTNYRHSTKDCARKRISFGLAFDIISYILKTKCRM